MFSTTNHGGFFAVKRFERTFDCNSENDIKERFTTSQPEFIAIQQKEIEYEFPKFQAINTIKTPMTATHNTTQSTRMPNTMDHGNEADSLQQQDQYMEQPGGGEDKGSEQVKRKRVYESDDGEDSETRIEEETGDSSDDDGDYELEDNESYLQTPSLTIPSPVEKKRPAVEDQLRAVAPSPSPKKAKGKFIEVRGNDEPVNTTGAGTDIQNSNHEGDEGNTRNKESKIFSGKGRKRQVAGSVTQRKLTVPKTKRAIQNPVLAPEALNNKKTTPKGTTMTKADAELMFDMAIEGANWGNITTELNKKSGMSMLSKNLKRHFTTVFKKQALSGYAD